MKVSTKGRYGIRALVDLAVYSANSHVTLASIAARQNISLNYLEQVFSILRKAGIVKSLKGSQGGYVLSRDPRQISLGEIFRILEGEFWIVDEDYSEVHQDDRIRMAIYELVFQRINEDVNTYLYNTFLSDLADDYRSSLEDMNGMYYI